MKIDPRILGALVLLGSTMVLSLVGDPTLDDQLRWHQDEFDRQLLDREVQIHPGELLELMHDDLVRLRIVDVRDEADYNLFHLADAERVDCEGLRADWGDDLSADTIVVLVGNDEARAEAGWRMLRARGIRNVYLLAGGLNEWMARHRDVAVRPRTTFATVASVPTTDVDECAQDEPFLWTLPAAVGDRHPAALPDAAHEDDAQHDEKPDYEKKVKRLSKAPKLSGGCG